MSGSGFSVGRNCPGGNFPGRNCPHGDIVRGNCPAGSLLVTVQGISVRYNSRAHMRRMYARLCACRSVEGSRRECGECSVWVLMSDYIRHIRTCRVS